jgi:hypothetical protein
MDPVTPPMCAWCGRKAHELGQAEGLGWAKGYRLICGACADAHPDQVYAPGLPRQRVEPEPEPAVARRVVDLPERRGPRRRAGAGRRPSRVG